MREGRGNGEVYIQVRRCEGQTTWVQVLAEMYRKLRDWCVWGHCLEVGCGVDAREAWERRHKVSCESDFVAVFLGHGVPLEESTEGVCETEGRAGGWVESAGCVERAMDGEEWYENDVSEGKGGDQAGNQSEMKGEERDWNVGNQRITGVKSVMDGGRGYDGGVDNAHSRGGGRRGKRLFVDVQPTLSQLDESVMSELPEDIRKVRVRDLLCVQARVRDLLCV